jgi:hypothetical protein
MTLAADPADYVLSSACVLGIATACNCSPFAMGGKVVRGAAVSMATPIERGGR